jgi:hypothetical protein
LSNCYIPCQGNRIRGFPFDNKGAFALSAPNFYPSFLRKQESMPPPGIHERLDSCLRGNDGIWEVRRTVPVSSAALGQMRLPHIPVVISAEMENARE